MRELERIKVYIKTENGNTVCMCCVSRKKCKCTTCEQDIVTRDRYEGWKSMLKRDRYGR